MGHEPLGVGGRVQGDLMTLSEWIEYLLIVNSDMSVESNQKFINSWITEELMLRGFKQDDIEAEFVNRGWSL